MFTQLIDPLDNLTLTCLVALVPVVSLLVMLAVFRLPAWLATLIGSIITFALALWVWRMPLDDGGHAYLYGAATGVWNVDWITIWGMVLFNTLGVGWEARGRAPRHGGRARLDRGPVRGGGLARAVSA